MQHFNSKVNVGNDWGATYRMHSFADFAAYKKFFLLLQCCIIRPARRRCLPFFDGVRDAVALSRAALQKACYGVQFTVDIRISPVVEKIAGKFNG